MKEFRFILFALLSVFGGFVSLVNGQNNVKAESKKKNLADFFLKMQPVRPLIEECIWGDINVLPRDTANGLEDSRMKNWCYWDGSIVKDDKGRYHIYCSRWTQSVAHSQGWKINSKAIHAVSSESLFGPYSDKGLAYPDWNEGKGSNVVGIKTREGKYAIISSEIVPGNIFISDNPNGPFRELGEIKIDYNGFHPGLAAYRGGKGNMANVQILLRPDGKYMLIGRSTAVMISDDNILGPYKIMTDRVYKNYPELPQERNEDPTLWYSGGLYHIVYNHWPSSTSYHFASKDGITGWKYCGIAYNKKDFKIFQYENGVSNNWKVVQRPTVYVEDGHVKCFLFSVIDVTKGGDGPNDNHGSKIVIVPFDGVAFDNYMKEAYDKIK